MVNKSNIFEILSFWRISLSSRAFEFSFFSYQHKNCCCFQCGGESSFIMNPLPTWFSLCFPKLFRGIFTRFPCFSWFTQFVLRQDRVVYVWVFHCMLFSPFRHQHTWIEMSVDFLAHFIACGMMFIWNH